MDDGTFEYLMMIGVGLHFGISLLSAAMLRRRYPAWARRRILIFAASPIPLILSALMSFVMVRVMMTPASECGVDACGMAMAAAIFGIFAAFIMFLMGMAMAYIGLRLSGRNRDIDVSETFR